MPAVVKTLQEFGNSAQPKQVLLAVQKAVDVPPEDLENKHKSGQSIFYNDVHWCREYLKKAGYIDSSKRGMWTLTPKGQTCVFTDATAQEVVRTVQERKKERKATSKSAPDISNDEQDLSEAASP